MFIVDDLVSWLIGRLADAGYQRLSTRVRGSDQERVLKRAAGAAVQATADEISPSDQNKADELAKQISRAFGKPAPVRMLPPRLTRLEGLYAAIAHQLSVPDEGGQPPVGLFGVPVSVVAALLGDHLVDEITSRGAEGGPLTPLAGQLNHDLTHLQVQRLEGRGQRIEDMLAQLLAARPAPAATATGPAGWLLAGVTDPFALEVHRPVESDVPQPGLPVLPVYVPRDHDTALAQVVTAAAAGASGMAVLVGGSSTGKTRACWQVLELLRGHEPGWRLWHPIDPPGALAGLPSVARQTVVWLNEAQRYLDVPDGSGERVAAGMRELLRNRDHGPVLVLVTLWPEYWDRLTARPPGATDPHPQARELLAAGHSIQVPAAFSPGQLRQLERLGDPRLVQAAAGSGDGQVIQYLAGAKELLDRYRNAPPAARALIDAAMDARRLGMRSAVLAEAFLETAAPGYLSDADWHLQPPDWLQKGLAYTAKPVKGVCGPLAPIRPRRASGDPPSPNGGSAWQLADYLDQQGRRMRLEKIPPPSFWDAVTSCADPADLTALAEAAWGRGQTLAAARLYKQACAHGDTSVGAELVFLMHTLHPGDQRPAGWAAAHASVDNSSDLWLLLYALRTAGTTGQITTLASRAAAHAPLDNPSAVTELLDVLRKAGATVQVTTLLDRDPAAHVTVDYPSLLPSVLDALRKAGATAQVTTLLDRIAAHAPLDNPSAVTELLDLLRKAGATAQVTALLDRIAAHAPLDNPSVLARLLNLLHEAGATAQVTTVLDRVAYGPLDNPAAAFWLLDVLREAVGIRQIATQMNRDNPAAAFRLLDALQMARADGQVTMLLDRAAAHAPLDDPGAVASLLRTLHAVGATGQVTALASRAAAHAPLDDPGAVATLLRVLHEAGATAQVTTLLDRDPAAHAPLDNLGSVARLLDALREASATAPVTALASRVAACGPLDKPEALYMLLTALRKADAEKIATLLDRDPAAHAPLDNSEALYMLLEALREAGATAQVTTLLDRDPAAHAPLDNLYAVAWLLRALHTEGAAGQVTTLASRAAAQAPLDNPGAVAFLLDALRQVSASAQAAELTERLPAAGLFKLFCRQEGRESQFRFGREADGRPAKPWGWTDLA